MTTWILLRAAGIGAYVALFLSVAWGLLASAGLTPPRISRSAANLFHASVASTGLALLALHLALLLVDPVEPFEVVEVLVPMRSPYRPVAVAFGVLAMYAFVAIVVTSWLRRRVGTAWWRRIHLAAVPTFAVSLVHGLLAGTDGGRTWAVALYGTTAAVVLFLVVVRGLTARPRPERRADARRTDPPRPDRSPVDDPRAVREPASAA